MTGRRENDDVSIGEIVRLLTSLKDEHGKKLDAIDYQVRITNGRTTALEVEMRGVKEDIREIKPILVAPPVPVMTPEGESLSVRISPKMWMAITAAGGSAFAGGIWLSGLIDKLFQSKP